MAHPENRFGTGVILPPTAAERIAELAEPFGESGQEIIGLLSAHALRQTTQSPHTGVIVPAERHSNTFAPRHRYHDSTVNVGDLLQHASRVSPKDVESGMCTKTWNAICRERRYLQLRPSPHNVWGEVFLRDLVQLTDSLRGEHGEPLPKNVTGILGSGTGSASYRLILGFVDEIRETAPVKKPDHTPIITAQAQIGATARTTFPKT